jgi:hypothetical protein
MMKLSTNEFDQTDVGWRKYSEYCPEVVNLMKEYLAINAVPFNQARNIHWHMGQIQAFNNDYKLAIANMKLSQIKEDYKKDLVVKVFPEADHSLRNTVTGKWEDIFTPLFEWLK